MHAGGVNSAKLKLCSSINPRKRDDASPGKNNWYDLVRIARCTVQNAFRFKIVPLSPAAGSFHPWLPFAHPRNRYFRRAIAGRVTRGWVPIRKFRALSRFIAIDRVTTWLPTLSHHLGCSMPRVYPVHPKNYPRWHPPWQEIKNVAIIKDHRGETW